MFPDSRLRGWLQQRVAQRVVHHVGDAPARRVAQGRRAGLCGLSILLGRTRRTTKHQCSAGARGAAATHSSDIAL